MRSGEEPVLTETGVNEPVPITDNGRELYVGSFNDGLIYRYPLPLIVQPPGDGFFPGMSDLSALALDGHRLYVAGRGNDGYEVREFRLPLKSGEKPSRFITGFSFFDFLGMATRKKTLYVASATAGTIAAYPLPLRAHEKAEFTILTTPQDDGATGVGLDRNASHLYVSLFGTGKVYEYALPYNPGDMPKVLDVLAQTNQFPYGVAVGSRRLFITTNGSLLSYRLPFTSHMKPVANLPFAGSPAGVAVDQ